MTFPPEVTSALIHSGPGAESLIEASAAWQQLGTNLEESAGVTAVALSSLVGSWQGPSAIAMAQAVEPYLTWLRNHGAASSAERLFGAGRRSGVQRRQRGGGSCLTGHCQQDAAGAVAGHQHIGGQPSGYRPNRRPIPGHVGEQLGGDESLSGGLGTSHHHAASVLFAALDYQSNWAGRSGQGDAHHRRRRSDQPRLRGPDERLFRSGQPVGEPVHFVRISL
jgi:hypothetical protein